MNKPIDTDPKLLWIRYADDLRRELDSARYQTKRAVSQLNERPEDHEHEINISRSVKAQLETYLDFSKYLDNPPFV